MVIYIDWVDDGGPRKIALRAQANIPAAFPIPIHEDMFTGAAAAFWDRVQPDGGDLRAYSDSGLTTGFCGVLFVVIVGRHPVCCAARSDALLTRDRVRPGANIQPIPCLRSIIPE